MLGNVVRYPIVYTRLFLTACPSLKQCALSLYNTEAFISMDLYVQTGSIVRERLISHPSFPVIDRKLGLCCDIDFHCMSASSRLGRSARRPESTVK